MHRISLQTLKCKIDRGDRFVLVSALNPGQFNRMHIPGSINVHDRSDLKAYLRPDDEIIVYCTEAGCPRSIVLGQFLSSSGFRHVQRFDGGLRSWVEAGLPTSQDVAWNIVPMQARRQLRKAQ
ncbi:MAG: rhodanese-like domain-containing protein [Saprospiraceae bacterium]|nr:rhodanese-like domain-containing protein [Saprospiraceae bacterium]